MCVVKISRNFTVDVDVYEKCREAGVNLSEAAEEGLRARLGGKGGASKDALKKLRGLPVHVVRYLKETRVKHPGQMGKALDGVNKFYGRQITVRDVDALLPVF